MNNSQRQALAATAAAFRAADIRLREADLVRRVTGSVPPTSCGYCGAPEATYGPARGTPGYRTCGPCAAAERAAGGETRFRHEIAALLLEIAGYIEPGDTIPAVEGPVYREAVGASPARPLDKPWQFFTERMLADLAERAGVGR